MEEQTTEAPPKPPATPPARPPTPPSAGPGRDEPLATRLVGRGGLVAAVVAIGVLLLAAAVLLRIPSFVDPSLFPSPEAHQDFVRILIGASALLVDVAMFLLLTLALPLGVLRTDLSDSTRKAFMAFALILFFFWFVSVLFQIRAIPLLP